MTQLEQLPARIDDLTSQISHLRTEMRDEFSAVRGEMVGQGTAIISTLRTEMAEQGTAIISTLRTEMAEQGAAIISTLRTEIAERDDARATQTRVLFEEVISRIALLQEGLAVHPNRRQRRKP